MFQGLRIWLGYPPFDAKLVSPEPHPTEYTCIEASLQFLDQCAAKDASKLYSSQVPFTKIKKPQTNIKSHEERLKVFNIRGHESKFSLDRHGFQLINHEINFNDWFNGPRIVNEVYPKVEELIRAQLGSEVRAVIHDHTV
jgi:hypothetical protein